MIIPAEDPASPFFYPAVTFRELSVKNIDALDETLAELDKIGRFEPVDTAVKQALRSMASALDADPSNAALWRQYREALGEVLRADDDADRDLAAALAEIRGATPVGD
jgi:hypothetical protein